MTGDAIVDHFYEAAFRPDLWISALERAAAATGSASASLVVYGDRDTPPRFRATPRIHEGLTRYVETGAWRTCPQARRAADTPWRGFLYSDEISPRSESGDPNRSYLLSIGLEAQINGVVTLPTGEFCGVTLERNRGDGRHTRRERALLDRLMPHLSRACLVAARLRLEAARSSAHAFSMLELPAAVIRGAGVVLAANDLFSSRADLFVEGGFGRLAMRDRTANALFQAALAELSSSTPATPRSIPVRSDAVASFSVVHTLPARRSAHELLSGADALVVVTDARQVRAIPHPPILIALFDFTASEAKLCVELAKNPSVAAAAATLGVTVKTARTYMDRIFAKSGVHTQAELLGMLRAAAPPTPP